MRISYRHETSTGAVYTLEQREDLLHVHSRVPQLELRWSGNSWKPERNWFERDYVFPIEVGLDEFLARHLPHLNGCRMNSIMQGRSPQLQGHSSFAGKWFSFESKGNMPPLERVHRSLLNTTAKYYGVDSLFG